MKSTLPGKTSLDQLLSSMSPELLEGEYVFCTVKNANYGDYAQEKPIATVAESEGLTLVLLKNAADQSGLRYAGKFRCITLNVHSSLQAVGLTAAVSAALTEHEISANVVAGYFHDHIFVQSELADRALGILLRLGAY